MSKKLSMSLASARQRMLRAARPCVEAVLVAAVALGFAQAGWAVMAPGSASAVDTPDNHTSEADTTLTATEVISPFAPELLDSGQTQAASALLSGVQLAGVRMADDPARSGAMLTLNDGSQRAFAIGQEIGNGVTLAEVGATYVVVSHAGGRQQIALAAPSYAGTPFSAPQPAPLVLQPAALTPANVLASAKTQPDLGATPAQPTVTPQASTATDGAAWLQATLAQKGEKGWLVADPLPKAALDAGLRAGDTIVAVNGAGPGDTAGLLAAAQGSRIVLGVERGQERLSLTIVRSEQR